MFKRFTPILFLLFATDIAFCQRVGIGTLTPAHTLDVSGTGRFTEVLTILTALPGTNTNQAASTAFVQAAIAAISPSGSSLPYTNTVNKYVNGFGNLSNLNLDSAINGDTNKFSQWKDADGGIFYDLGNVGIGNVVPHLAKLQISGGFISPFDHLGLLLEGTYSGSASSHHAITVRTSHNLATGMSVALFDADGQTSGSNNLDHIVGFQSRQKHNGTGTLGSMYSLVAAGHSDGGNITNNYGIFIAEKSGTGTMTNNYGIFMTNQSGGTGKNYGIWQQGRIERNYFEGVMLFNNSIGINTGTISPVKTLEVVAKSGEDATIRLNQPGLNWWDLKITTASSDLQFADFSGNQKMALAASGKLRLPTYGIGKHAGTPVKSAYFDADGYLIEGAYIAPASISGTTNYIPKFTGDLAIGSSIMYDNGSKIGIGTEFPISRLSIDSGLNIDQANVNGFQLESALTFGNNKKVGIGSRRTPGANQSGLDFYTQGARRMGIDSTGNVGIGTTIPGYRLHVLGDAFVSNRLSVGVGLAPLYPLHTSTAYFKTRIGVGTEPDTTYAIDAAGAVRLQNDLRINGTLNPNNALTIGSNTTIEGNATIQSSALIGGNVTATGAVSSNGRGLVKGTNSAMQRMERNQAELIITALPPGNTVNSAVYTYPGGNFSGTPFVMIGQLLNSVGDEASWIQLTPIEVTPSSFKIRAFNHSSSNATLTANYEVLIIGPE